MLRREIEEFNDPRNEVDEDELTKARQKIGELMADISVLENQLKGWQKTAMAATSDPAPIETPVVVPPTRQAVARELTPGTFYR